MWKNITSGSTMENAHLRGFLGKIWKIVDDRATDDIIGWSPDGQSFIIYDQMLFAKELLPTYFKHNNMASFIRQLNMYGFHKVVSIEGNSLKYDKEEVTFAHQFFIKDQPELLENIKRKKSNAPFVSSEDLRTQVEALGGKSQDHELLSKVLFDVNYLKKSQDTWDSRLKSMKRENEALWRELAVFRQKHLKQEQIINKLIHFIVTIVQPSSRNVQLRRRYPLMINDARQLKNLKKLNSTDGSQGSPSGPTIHEIDPADVLFTAPDESATSIDNEDFISTDLMKEVTEMSDGGIVLSPESTTSVLSPGMDSYATSPRSKPEVVEVTNPDKTKLHSWLNVDLDNDVVDDDEICDPLTFVDPAQVNPTIAAEVLSNRGKTNKRASLHLGDKTKTWAKQEERKRHKQQQQAAGKTVKSAASTSVDRLFDVVGDSQAVDPLATVDNDSQQLLLSLTRGTGGVQLGQGTLSSDLFNLTRGANFIGKMKTNNKSDTDNDPTLGTSLLPVVRNQPTSNNTDGITRYDMRELGSHVENVQNDLDILKDILKGDGCSIDANTLLGLFSDDPMSYSLPPADTGERGKENGMGGELISYNTPSLDLSDLLSIANTSSEWSPPSSPTNDDLSTPQPTPQPPEFPTPAKRRKK